MFRRINFYSLCLAFSLSVLLILAGSRYTDNTSYRPFSEIRRNIRDFLKLEDGDDSFLQPLPSNPFDESLDIDKMFERTRSRIKFELSNYNYTYSGAHDLDDLLMETGGQPIRSLIVSTWGSGTSFLGEVLNAMPGNFYYHEPLHKYEVIQIRGPPHSRPAINMLKQMLKCDFQNMDDYFLYGKSHLHQFTKNPRLWDHCDQNEELCFDPEFTSKCCKLFPFQSMKVVRIRLRLIQELLEDKELNLKVVLLIRDPRGVMRSRQYKDFCEPLPDCWQADFLCADMISDYVAASRLLEKNTNRLMVLRYEELALKPNSTTKEIFKFLGLGMMPAVAHYLQFHSTRESGGVASTFRISYDVPFRWKNLLNYSYVNNIQVACKDAMDLWGYRTANNASHMSSKDFYPLEDYVIQQ